MDEAFNKTLELVLDKLPGFVQSLNNVSPYLLTAVIGAVIIHWTILPLIRAWKDKD